MFRSARFGRLLGASLLAGCFGLTSLHAEEVSTEQAEAAFKGKTINFIVALAAGGGYDQYARTMARYLERHIPGHPNVVVQNMTGAAGMRATNWLYVAAPRDGLTIGITQRSVLVEPLYGTKEATFDPTKFSWIASLNDEAFIAVTWKGRGLDHHVFHRNAKAWNELNSKVLKLNVEIILCRITDLG